MLESYDSLYDLGKIAAAAAVTYAAIQGVTLLGVLDGLSEDSEFSKSQNQYFAKDFLEDTENILDKILFSGARLAAKMSL